MKIVALVARILLGLMFTFFGLNGVLQFLKMGAMPDNPGGHFMTIMMDAHYFAVVGTLMAISGVLFLVGRFVPLAVVLIGPVIVNIDLYHILLAPYNFVPAIVVTILWFVVAYSVRSAFSGIFQAKVAS